MSLYFLLLHTLHVWVSAHVRYALFAPLLSLSFINEVNYRKLSAVGYSAAEHNLHGPLVLGGVITEQFKNKCTIMNTKHPCVACV